MRLHWGRPGGPSGQTAGQGDAPHEAQPETGVPIDGRVAVTVGRARVESGIAPRPTAYHPPD